MVKPMVVAVSPGAAGTGKPGDWQCPNRDCQNNRKYVFGSKDECPQCGTPKPARAVQRRQPVAMQMQPVLPMPTVGAGKPGDWQCPNIDCQNHRRMVFASNTTCPKCGCSKPMPIPAGGKPGDWSCPNRDCQNHRKFVFARKDECPQCGTPKPEYASTVPAAPAAPTVHTVHSVGGNGRVGDWQCPNSECVNHRRMVFGSNDACPKCGELKPLPPGYGGSNPNDWVCPNRNCQNHERGVFAKHSACPKCGTEKPGGSVRSRPY